MGEFGDFISKKRKEKGVSLRTMAKDINISVSYLSDLEQGLKLPPNSSNEKYKHLLKSIMDYLELNEKDRKEYMHYADIDLIKKGHISSDITNYMEQTPLASVALRKAKELNFTDNEWKEIIEKLEKR